ncbi:MAG: RecB family exonuclease [Fimbriimonas sp.]
MARKPTISPTKISIYLACPVRYRWTYIDDRGRWYMRAKSCYSFGTTLHKVLERFHDEGDVGVSTVGQVVSAYEESWIDAGFRSADEMAEAFGEGLQILERHVQESYEKPSGAKTLFVEKQLKEDMGPFFLAGRLDRVDEYEDGTIEVVDYKSGRETVCEEELKTDIAMSVYQLLLKKKYPDRPVRSRIIALRSGDSAVWQMEPAEMELFENAVRQIGNEILGEDYYERTPVMKALCNGCDFLPLCRKDPSFD